jgi:hypothetical protein
VSTIYIVLVTKMQRRVEDGRVLDHMAGTSLQSRRNGMNNIENSLNNTIIYSYRATLCTKFNYEIVASSGLPSLQNFFFLMLKLHFFRFERSV